jgi:hypothetical protein
MNPVMARIKAECPGCGVVRLPAPQVYVQAVAGQAPRGYRFECPECAHSVVRETSPAICAVLVSVGAHEEWVSAASVGRRGDASFTEDDVVAFRRVLQGDDWIHTLDATEPPPSVG